MCCASASPSNSTIAAPALSIPFTTAIVSSIITGLKTLLPYNYIKCFTGCHTCFPNTITTLTASPPIIRSSATALCTPGLNRDRGYASRHSPGLSAAGIAESFGSGSAVLVRLFGFDLLPVAVFLFLGFADLFLATCKAAGKQRLGCFAIAVGNLPVGRLIAA